jgi:hypothetical protein
MGKELMPSPKYPLECVVQARGKKVERAERELAAAAGAMQAADRVRAEAELRRDRHEATASHVCGREIDALWRGELRVQDLNAAHQWAMHDAVEDRRLRTEAEQARADSARAASTEQTARTELALRKAEAEVIEHDRSRWRRGQRKKIEVREEEALFEAWRPKK